MSDKRLILFLCIDAGFGGFGRGGAMIGCGDAGNIMRRVRQRFGLLRIGIIAQCAGSGGMAVMLWIL